MLRVVLCIICLHPFLWLFLFALLYHTVKDFFVLILLKTCEFCMVLVFLGRSTDFVAALGVVSCCIYFYAIDFCALKWYDYFDGKASCDWHCWRFFGGLRRLPNFHRYRSCGI